MSSFATYFEGIAYGYHGGLGLLLVVSYSFIYLVPTDKLPFGLIFEKTAIVLLLLIYRLLLLGYVFVVGHMSFG